MGPRYSIIPSRFFDDDRLKPSHFKVMGYLGKHSDRSGWMKLSQTKAAGDDKLNISRETICRAIADLVEWGYVEKRSQKETKRSICFYRILMDDIGEPVENVPEIGGGVTQRSQGGCDGTSHTSVTPQITGGVISEVTPYNVPSSKIRIQRSGAGAPSADSKSDLGSAGSKPSKAVPCFVIQPADTAWQYWIDHFRNTGQAELAFDAGQRKRIRASSRFPGPDSTVFEPAPRKASAANTKRIVGEGEAA